MIQNGDNERDPTAEGFDDAGSNEAGKTRDVDEAPVRIEVNGVPIEVAGGKPVPVSEVLDDASDNYAIAGNPVDYILETPSGDKLGRHQTIEPTPGEEFLAMPGGPTPVA